MMAAVAVQTQVEILTAAPAIPRALTALQALTSTVPIGLGVHLTTRYLGAAPWLLFWGPGEPVRAAAMRQHVAAGGHAIALDLAYWSRARKVRISIDAPHPQAWVMRRSLSPQRLALDRPPMANAWTPSGPIVIAGVGCKARTQYGAEMVQSWEDQMAASCRRRYPGRPIVRRPKKPVTLPIERVLIGASLLITWHSNVAVDAIRLGIPVVCRDGAAAAVCPSDLPDEPRPLSLEVRDQFLANLAWFQWDPTTEGAACWAFLEEVLA